jgi:protein-tyrosine phosphatase
VTADVTIDGVFNFRDLGGGATADGRPVRTGVLYRSASLDRITAAGLAALEGLGVRTVVDLRSANEIERHGRFPHERSSIRWVHLPSPIGPPVDGAAPSGPNLSFAQVTDHDEPLTVVFEGLMTHGAAFVGEILRLVAERENQPVVFHCTSGKDRTGVVAALIHLIIGCDLERALTDFERSGEAFEQIRADMASRFAELARLPPEKLERFSSADRRLLMIAFAAIGGLDALDPWLDGIGVDATVRARLRDQLVA